MVREAQNKNTLLLHEMAAQLEEISRQVAALSAVVTERLIDERPRQELAIIVEAVAQSTGVPVAVIKGKQRAAPYATARHIAFWLSCRLTSHSLERVGKFFSKDHSSVANGRDRIEGWRLGGDKRFAQVKALRVSLESALALKHHEGD